ncbi:hypothetical protein PSQ90_04160 [Devosia rhodophyticola]|uniref:DUF6894 domain-containing protein n=1 Tax=Devosia rhodophyticola TaxID=3026423 RepID=A0ABY7YZ50_9HYPH|nr:hypothetical protein [Devosia rhodophyticola]WDR06665.1 hypothetical protein PSQ90_04160 [Devosia rhodophyticola]
MPRFFFHYRTDDDFVVDEIGQDLPDVEAAHEQAADIGRTMLSRALENGEKPNAARCIEIVDEEGVEVLYIVFWASASKPGTLDAEELLKPPTLH